MKKFFCTTLLLCLFSSCTAHAKSTVTLAELHGTVGVQMEEFVKEVIHDSESKHDSLIIFELDTPGGLVEAMRGIVQAILASRVPIAIWIPSGGQGSKCRSVHRSVCTHSGNVPGNEYRRSSSRFGIR